MRWHRTSVVTLVLVGVIAAPVAAANLGSPRDVKADSVHAEGIDWLVEHGITGGCAPELFCPNDPVSRAQLATFLRRLANAGVVDAATVAGLSASDLQGQTGPAGPQGPAGPRGSAGPKGDTGLTGTQGERGLTGQAGNSMLGLPGAPDAAIGDIGDLYLDITAIALYGPKNADGWGDPTSLMGEDGEKGAPGVDGDVGAPGADGDTGMDGTDGRTWLNGSGEPAVSLGVDGDLYLDTASDSYYGPKSGDGWGDPISLVGSQGEQGTQGEQGEKGDTGEQGIQGIQGKIGGVGEQGIQGDKGDVGEQGPEGPAGTVSTRIVTGNVVTTMYYDVATSTAQCDPGEVLLSGGYEVMAPHPHYLRYTTVFENRPSSNSTAWQVSASSDMGEVNFQAYAICAVDPS